MLERYWKTVDYGIGLVLFLTCFLEYWQYGFSAYIISAQFLNGSAIGKCFFQYFRSFLCYRNLIGFWIVVVFAIHYTMAVANHPHLLKGTAKDHGARRHPLYRISL